MSRFSVFAYLFISLPLSQALNAQTIPVFRTPNSQFHSGHSDLQTLWKNSPSKKDEAARQTILWAQVTLMKQKKAIKAWIPKKQLLFKKELKTSYILSKEKTIFHEQPLTQSKVLLLLSPDTKLKILNKISIDKRTWFKVRWNKIVGYVLKEQTLNPHMLADNEAFVREKGFLRENPRPNSKQVSAVEKNQRLRVLRIQKVHWQKAKLKNLGVVWWSLSSLQTSEVSKQNSQNKAPPKIGKTFYDMVTLPFPPFDQLISASGIFLQGKKKLSQLSFFGDRDYTLAVSRSGLIFVGPFFSSDHGVSYQPYIDWPSLVKTLPSGNISNLQIDSIDVKNESGSELLLSMSLNEKEHQIYTADRGKNWILIK